MESVFLARHAESDYSAKGLVNGDPSLPVRLTEEGRRQARTLGQALAGEEVDLCVVTEFPRTRETAERALADRAVPFLVVPELNDPDYGDFEGASLDEYRGWLREHGSGVRIPGSRESRLDLVSRYIRGFRLVLSRPEEVGLCVLHSLPLAYVAGALDGRAPAPRMPVVGYAEVVPVEAAALDRVVGRLEAWCAAPTW
jgi:2,3-bisphosphoglycerate-dependent phosphoglycerate mutase